MSKWSGGNIVIDSGEIKNASVSSTVGDEIDADKLQHVYQAGTNFGIAIGSAPSAKHEIVHVASYAGTIRGFHAVLNDTGSSTSVTFDLKKNGTTVLSSPITITHSIADKAVQDGTLSSTTFAADDIISIDLAVSSSTGAQGPYAFAVLEETRAGS